MRSFWQALLFLTVFPAPAVAWQRGDLGRAAAFFPLVGVVIGGCLAAVWEMSRWLFPSNVVAVVVVIVWAAVTGGLHLDGLADCGDGLFAPVKPERRLEIMKDARVGAFGVVTLALLLLLKIAAVASLNSAWSLLLAPVSGRWLIVPTAQRPTARPGGLGAEFATTLTSTGVWGGLLTAVGIALLCGWRGIIALISAYVVTWLIWQFVEKRLGGVTGDVLGLVVEVVEVVVLLVFVASV